MKDTKSFWDHVYSEKQYVYGTEPNEFFKQYLNSCVKSGYLLLPGEGEGRNAVYAARKNWRVDAFDISNVAQRKAIALAKQNKVKINYWIQDLLHYVPRPDTYDLIGFFFVHLPKSQRKYVSERLWEALKPGGKILFEVFELGQLELRTGGPTETELLYDAQEFHFDFPCFRIEFFQSITRELHEGSRHNGPARVIQCIGYK